jgi:DNA-binding winged helix-turn-helix (wHTH) protein/TolB-like protein/Tfp pilus assembly protein PilF
MDAKPLIYKFADVSVDLERFEVLKGVTRARLEPKAFATLVYLIENQGRLVEKKELLDAVWKDAFVTENAMTRVIAQLRKALGDDSKEAKYIETVPTRGYRFIAHVEAGDSSETGSLGVVIQEEQDDKKARGASKETSAALAPKRRLKASHTVIITGLLFVTALVLSYSRIADRSNKPPSIVQIKSIAVLPFKPLVAESRDEALELGLADSLITKLTTIKELVVKPTSSVRKYVGVEQNAVAIGRLLKVDAVLESSTQLVGDKIRIRSQLVSVSDGNTLWTYQCDEKCADIFAAQDSISEDIASALALNLNSEERELLKKRYTEDGDAYRFYLRGRFFWNKRTEEGMKKALESFVQATQADPGYALAYAGMADCYFNISLPPKEKWAEAKAAAVKALELDNTLAEAHTSLAYARMNYDWDRSAAESEFKRAIAINPNYATAHYWYGEYLSAIGRHNDGIAETERALELDSTSLIINANLGRLLYYARQYDLAIKQLQATLDLDDSFARAHRNLGWALEQKGMYEEAIREFQKAITLSGGANETVSSLGHAYAASGERAKAREIINKLKQQSKRRYISPFDIAIIYVGLGEKARAFEWLERAYDDRSLWMVFLNVDPRLENLRSDPRFTGLLRRVELPLDQR